MSASRRKPYTRRINRDKIAGGRGRERRSRSGSLAALIARLRRVERVTLHLSGVRNLTPEHLDNILRMMVDSDSVVEPKPSGDTDRGEEVQVSHEGSLDWEAEGDDET